MALPEYKGVLGAIPSDWLPEALTGILADRGCRTCLGKGYLKIEGSKSGRAVCGCVERRVKRDRSGSGSGDGEGGPLRSRA